MKVYEPHASSVGRIAANLIAMLCYILMPFAGTLGLVLAIILLYCEKNSGLVKFHVVQAGLLWVLRWVLITVLDTLFRHNWFDSLWREGGGLLAGVFGFFSWTGSVFLTVGHVVITVCVVGLCILGAVSAYRWTDWHVPLIGALADRLLGRIPQAAYNGAGPVPPGCESPATTHPPAGGEPAPSAGEERQAPPAMGAQPPASGAQGSSPHGAPPEAQ